MRNVHRIPPAFRLVAKAITTERVRARLHDWDYQVGQTLATYQHHLNFSSAVTAAFHTLAQTARRIANRPRILCYPELPVPGAVFYKLCLHRGYALTNDPDVSYDAVIKWEDATYSPTDATLRSIASDHPVLNRAVSDISKGRVSDVFENVFGYSLSVEPTTFDGPILRKSEENAAHDGTVLQGPIDRVDSDAYVYQRLINNVENGLAKDVRVPVFGECIPFVRIKYRPEEQRFDHAGQSQVADEVRRPAEVFSPDEHSKILEMCRCMGLDYGELDVLRDKDTGRIYVVDVNDTPTGPTFVSASKRTVKWCYDEMAKAMDRCLFNGSPRRRS